MNTDLWQEIAQMALPAFAQGALLAAGIISLYMAISLGLFKSSRTDGRAPTNYKPLLNSGHHPTELKWLNGGTTTLGNHK